jgi:hypothetical protein
MGDVRALLCLAFLLACEQPAHELQQPVRCHVGALIKTGKAAHWFETSPEIKSVNILTLPGLAYEECGGIREPRDLVIDPAGAVMVCKGESCWYLGSVSSPWDEERKEHGK